MHAKELQLFSITVDVPDNQQFCYYRILLDRGFRLTEFFQKKSID